MNQVPPPIVRPGFVLSLIVAIGVLFIVAKLLPDVGGSKRAKLPQVIGNLRQIDLAKQMWAADHAATNGASVSERDLAEYLRLPPGSTGLVTSVDWEVYRPNGVGRPPEAQLEKPFGSRFPKGTLVRWSTNTGCEILLPNPQGGATGWQPLYSATNRTPAAAAPRRSP
jgi:hypothetical protein